MMSDIERRHVQWVSLAGGLVKLLKSSSERSGTLHSYFFLVDSIYATPRNVSLISIDLRHPLQPTELYVSL